MTLLANLFRTVGAVVHVEHRIFSVNRQRPDLLVITPERSVLVDVAVVHPAAPSRTTVGHDVATRAMEGNKRAKYDHLARLQGASLLAFAVETFGGFGKQAVEIIDLLKAASFSSAPLHFHTSLSTAAAQMLAVALQRGNALVARAGALRARAAAAPRDRQ